MIDIEPGIHSISNEIYHASKGFSRSDIMIFKKSPAHFWHQKINLSYVKGEPTKDMKFGEAIHTFLLENDQFKDRYVIEEKINRRSTAGKKSYKEMLEKNKGKIILSSEDMINIQGMSEVIFKNEQCSQLIKDAKYEKSIYWIDPETQILCKVRPDIWHENFIVDYKTKVDASERSFQKSLYDYGYYMQFAMMHEAIKHTLKKQINNFVFLVQEKTEPYLTAIYQLDFFSLEKGIEEFHNILWQIKSCSETNYYPGYPTKIISLPNWSN